MARCGRHRTPGDPRRGLYAGVALVGIGVGLATGQGIAAASPSEAADTTQSAGAGVDKPGPAAKPADTSETSDASSDRSDDSAAAREPDADTTRAERRAAAAAPEEVAAIAPRTASAADPTRDPRKHRSARKAATPVAAPQPPTDGQPARTKARRSLVQPSVAAAAPKDEAPTPATTPPPATFGTPSLAPTLRTVVAQRPLTVKAIATDVLTWAGLRPPTDGLPLPAAPVSALVESLWLAVRQTQYTVNNQRPTTAATTSGPGSDDSVGGSLNAVPQTDSIVPDLGDLSVRDGVEVTTNASGGARTIDGRFTDRVVASTADAAAVMNEFAPALGAAAGFADPASITVTRAGTGDTAENFYRFTENIGGIEVIGSDVIVVTDGAGAVTGLVNNYRGLSGAFDITPDAAVDDDKEVDLIAGRAYLGAGATRFAVKRFVARSTFTRQLVVDALDDQGTPMLAWRVVVQLPARRLTPGATYLIGADGAETGDVIVGVSNAEPLTAVAVSKDWLGRTRSFTVDARKRSWYTIYRLVDSGRGITTYKTAYPLFGLGGAVLPGTVVKRGVFGWNTGGVSAHANTEVVYDYYLDVLGRTSFDDNGHPIKVSIQYNPNKSAGGGYANAFWDPTREQFAFGDSGHLEAAVDVIGHEYTHAVISYAVGGVNGGSVLDYGESGALNEAMADIMGVLIEGKSGPDRWLLGEDSQLGAVRNLADPTSISTSLGPYRDSYATRYKGLGDDAGEHINSTIFSHAAYEMMTDPATAGVSDDIWAAVFYHALYRLSPGSVFTDGRAAVLSSARALGLSAAELAAIRNAFDSVGIVGTATSSSVAA